MKKFIFVAVLLVGLTVSPLSTQAAGLTSAQIQSIISLLTSFYVDNATIATVQQSLFSATVTPPTIQPITAVTVTSPLTVYSSTSVTITGTATPFSLTTGSGEVFVTLGLQGYIVGKTVKTVVQPGGKWYAYFGVLPSGTYPLTIRNYNSQVYGTSGSTLLTGTFTVLP